MPIYEYECTDCGNRFEILQRINEKPRIFCKKCESKNVRRIMSTGTFIFKGTGFYATDYKDKARKLEKTEAPSCSSCAESKSCPANKNEN
ncbi:MAG TPA: zinc ribbon domain-containing protein [archaeon]|nr:zinc ribbon domain-containing protein [archaeon]